MEEQRSIRTQMNRYWARYGKVDTDTIEQDGTRVFIVAPNRFGEGYMEITLATGEVWTADFSRRVLGVTPPKRLQGNALLKPYGAR